MVAIYMEREKKILDSFGLMSMFSFKSVLYCRQHIFPINMEKYYIWKCDTQLEYCIANAAIEVIEL